MATASKLYVAAPYVPFASVNDCGVFEWNGCKEHPISSMDSWVPRKHITIGTIGLRSDLLNHRLITA